MAKLSTEELLEQFKELTLIELSEFVKAFEETFEVSAAARLLLLQLLLQVATLLKLLKSRPNSTLFLKLQATRRSRSSRLFAN